MPGNPGETGKGMGGEAYIAAYKTMTHGAKEAIGDEAGRFTPLGKSIEAFESLLEDGALVQGVDPDGNPVIDVNPDAGQSGG